MRQHNKYHPDVKTKQVTMIVEVTATIRADSNLDHFEEGCRNAPDLDVLTMYADFDILEVSKFEVT